MTEAREYSIGYWIEWIMRKGVDDHQLAKVGALYAPYCKRRRRNARQSLVSRLLEDATERMLPGEKMSSTKYVVGSIAIARASSEWPKRRPPLVDVIRTMDSMRWVVRYADRAADRMERMLSQWHDGKVIVRPVMLLERDRRATLVVAPVQLSDSRDKGGTILDDGIVPLLRLDCRGSELSVSLSEELMGVLLWYGVSKVNMDRTYLGKWQYCWSSYVSTPMLYMVGADSGKGQWVGGDESVAWGHVAAGLMWRKIGELDDEFEDGGFEYEYSECDE